MEQAHQLTGRSSKFLKDIGIYAIGNLGSKLITFLMVPLYTHFIDKTGDFGYFDICLSTCFLLMPLVTLQLRDGAFRFLLDCDDERERCRIITAVYSTVATLLGVAAAVTLCVAMLIGLRFSLEVVLLLVAVAVFEVIPQVYRGLGDNKAFVLVGILSSLGIALFSLLFVVGFEMGVAGIFWANIAARLCALALVETRMRTVRHYFDLHCDYRLMLKPLLRFSVPLLPMMMTWWLLSYSDRWFIQMFVGLDSLGVYAVAARFTSIIYTFTIIFLQAWQETAILQYDSDDRDAYFSKIFSSYVFLLGGLVLLYLLGMKVVYPLFIQANYRSGMAYVYPLAVSAVVYASANFFDYAYQCAKDTRRSMLGSVLTAAVNIALNLVLAPRWGVWGVIATLFLSYLFFLVFRWWDTRRYFVVTPTWRLAVPPLLVAAGAVPFYLSTGLWLDVAALVILLALLAWAAPSFLVKDARGKITAKFHKGS